MKLTSETGQLGRSRVENATVTARLALLKAPRANFVQSATIPPILALKAQEWTI
jgi:hypothetical protein